MICRFPKNINRTEVQSNLAYIYLLRYRVHYRWFSCISWRHRTNHLYHSLDSCTRVRPPVQRANWNLRHFSLDKKISCCLLGPFCHMFHIYMMFFGSCPEQRSYIHPLHIYSNCLSVILLHLRRSSVTGNWARQSSLFLYRWSGSMWCQMSCLETHKT